MAVKTTTLNVNRHNNSNIHATLKQTTQMQSQLDFLSILTSLLAMPSLEAMSGDCFSAIIFVFLRYSDSFQPNRSSSRDGQTNLRHEPRSDWPTIINKRQKRRSDWLAISNELVRNNLLFITGKSERRFYRLLIIAGQKQLAQTSIGLKRIRITEKDEDYGGKAVA